MARKMGGEIVNPEDNYAGRTRGQRIASSRARGRALTRLNRQITEFNSMAQQMGIPARMGRVGGKMTARNLSSVPGGNMYPAKDVMKAIRKAYLQGQAAGRSESGARTTPRGRGPIQRPVGARTGVNYSGIPSGQTVPQRESRKGIVGGITDLARGGGGAGGRDNMKRK